MIHLEINGTQREYPQRVSLKVHAIVDDALRDYVEVFFIASFKIAEELAKAFNVSHLLTVAYHVFVIAKF
jgi:hypothetical protein